MKLRLFRPVPSERWRAVLGQAAKVVVIDRNLTAGLGGVFASEVQAALYPLENRPLIFTFVAGLGGRDVTPEDVRGIVYQASECDETTGRPIFWGLKQ
jgi:pyruvate/2-oxoacid:ferredoxin oxidoreductase alpha subunit